MNMAQQHFSALNEKEPKRSKQQPGKRGSRPLQERANARRTAHQGVEAQEAGASKQHKKAARQDREARRHDIETLIEAYAQDHIGGNHSQKTLEWHRTALGLLRLFLQLMFRLRRTS